MNDEQLIQKSNLYYVMVTHQILYFKDSDETHHHHWPTGLGTGGGDGPRCPLRFLSNK